MPRHHKASPAGRTALLAAIKADIVKHLQQRDLSVTTVAARHGITPRYVQMLFEAEATTFSKFVLHQRLARAHRLLVDPCTSAWPIRAIALEAGFANVSYFNRAFRRRYGTSPSRVREAACLSLPRAELATKGAARSARRVRSRTTPTSLQSKTGPHRSS